MYDRTIQMIEAMRERQIFPGACVSFFSKGQSKDYVTGYAQLVPEQVPMRKQLLFDVASLTKVICTTTVVLQLMEEGQLVIDHPLKDYLPQFNDPKITIRHLLTHTADIHTYIENRDSLSKDALREAYYQVHSGADRGKIVSYTDTGTILLGFMLENMLNKNVVDIFRERVLLPLQMRNSLFLPEEAEDIVPTELHPVRGLIHGATHDPKAFVLAEHAGNAGLFTNMADLKKFVQMYLHKGKAQGQTFLEKETIMQLLSDQTPLKMGNRSLGWALKQDRTGQNLLFHTGYTGTFLLIDPVKNESMIFLSNRVHPVDKRALYIKERDLLINTYLNEK